MKDIKWRTFTPLQSLYVTVSVAHYYSAFYKCIENVGKDGGFQAGTTYIAQMAAHDSFLSVSPLLAGRAIPGSTGVFNMIEYPYTLTTLYGEGPRLSHHLYDKNMKFRATHFGVPSVYDMRNLDTLMLQNMTEVWKNFHNKIMDNRAKSDSKPDKDCDFAIARASLIASWHQIIKNDFLNKVLHQDFAVRSAEESIDIKSNEPGLDDDKKCKDKKDGGKVDLAHGLFRAFHCLPLSLYRISNLNEQSHLNQLFVTSQGDAYNWQFHWPHFFDTANSTDSGSDLAANRTAFTPSFSDEFSVSDRKQIGHADYKSAIQNKTASLEEIFKHFGEPHHPEWADGHWISKIKTAIESANAIQGNPVDSEAIDQFCQNPPLSIFCLVEAGELGVNGSLGPYCSKVFKELFMPNFSRAEAINRKLYNLGNGDNSPILEFTSFREIIKYISPQEKG